jgi:hypothetical protein
MHTLKQDIVMKLNEQRNHKLKFADLAINGAPTDPVQFKDEQEAIQLRISDLQRLLKYKRTKLDELGSPHDDEKQRQRGRTHKHRRRNDAVRVRELSGASADDDDDDIDTPEPWQSQAESHDGASDDEKQQQLGRKHKHRRRNDVRFELGDASVDADDGREHCRQRRARERKYSGPAKVGAKVDDRGSSDDADEPHSGQMSAVRAAAMLLGSVDDVEESGASDDVEESDIESDGVSDDRNSSSRKRDDIAHALQLIESLHRENARIMQKLAFKDGEIAVKVAEIDTLRRELTMERGRAKTSAEQLAVVTQQERANRDAYSSLCAVSARALDSVQLSVGAAVRAMGLTHGIIGDEGVTRAHAQQVIRAQQASMRIVQVHATTVRNALEGDCPVASHSDRYGSISAVVSALRSDAHEVLGDAV